MTEKSSTVSVITRTRDRPILLGRALESVLNQSFANWRHIIVNDGGDIDELDKFLAPYADRYAGRLTVVHNAKSLGMQGASNAGLARADGDYVAIHDDDDEWHPEFLAATVAFLDEKGQESVYQGVIAHTVKVLEDIDSQGRVVDVERDAFQPEDEVDLFKVGYKNPFPPIAFLYRRSVHDAIGLFNERYGYVGDLDFNVRFLLKWEIGVVSRPLAYYHLRRKGGETYGNSVTSGVRVHERLFNEYSNDGLRAASGEGGKDFGLAFSIGRRFFFTEERLLDLKTHLGSVSGILAGISEACAQTVDQSTDLKAHLESVSGAIETILLAGADSAGRDRDLKAHLNSVGGMLAENALPKLADLKAHLESVSGAVNAVIRFTGEAANREEELGARLGEVAGELEKIELRQRAAEERDAALAGAIGSLRADIDRWREEDRAREIKRAKGLRIGRLWMRWRKKGEV